MGKASLQSKKEDKKERSSSSIVYDMGSSWSLSKSKPGTGFWGAAKLFVDCCWQQSGTLSSAEKSREVLHDIGVVVKLAGKEL